VFGATDRVQVEAGPAYGYLDLNMAVPVGLVAAEAIANAFKHGLPGEREGRIWVSFRPPVNGREGELVVRDNGLGLSETSGTETGGAGLVLVKAIARQVGGHVSLETRNGTEFRLSFRAGLPPRRRATR
jgi:two-component sensor histidine kinase